MDNKTENNTERRMSRSEFMAHMSSLFTFVVGGTMFGRFMTDAEAEEIKNRIKDKNPSGKGRKKSEKKKESPQT